MGRGCVGMPGACPISRQLETGGGGLSPPDACLGRRLVATGPCAGGLSPGSVAQEGGDPLDRLEILHAQRARLPAVPEGLMDGEVEPVLLLFHAGPIERTVAAVDRGTPTLRTPPRGPLRPVLVEQHLDAPVRGRLQGLLPPRGRPPVAPGFLPPALDGRALFLLAPLLQDGT